MCAAVRRDLKSSNILLTAEGVAKVADVGLAKMAGHADLSYDPTAGTFAYAAPELLLGAICSTKARQQLSTISFRSPFIPDLL